MTTNNTSSKNTTKKATRKDTAIPTLEDRCKEIMRSCKDTIVLAGFGIHLHTEKGALTIRDGIRSTSTTNEPLTYTIDPFNQTVKTIICYGYSGNFSMDALQFCSRHEIALYRMNTDTGEMEEVTGIRDNEQDIKLRKLQYMIALDDTKSAHMALWFVKSKLDSYQRALSDLSSLPVDQKRLEHAQEVVRVASAWFASYPERMNVQFYDVGYARAFEGSFSQAWLQALSSIDLQWKTSDIKRLPASWLRDSQRTSPLAPNDNGRHAIHPLQAILNYAYGCLEADILRALTQSGYDTLLAYLHADKKHRNSLVYDVMEPLRAIVDLAVCKLVQRTTFTARDFLLQSNGNVKLHSSLARYVAYACRVPYSMIQETVQSFGQMLSQIGASEIQPVSIPTMRKRKRKTA